MNQIDIAVITLTLLFAYKGYRSGLVSVVLGLTGGLLAFGLAAALAPLVAPSLSPFLSERLGVPTTLLRPALVIALTVALRFLLGFAVRELVQVVRMLVHGIPPLALADRVLGILPSAALGALLGVALVLVALNLPLGEQGHRQLEQSWVTRNVIDQPRATVARLREIGTQTVTHPPRLNGYLLGAGVGGLALAGIAAGRLRGPAAAAALAEAPTRRIQRPAAATEVADPTVWLRRTFGIGVALAMAAVLLAVSAARLAGP